MTLYEIQKGMMDTTDKPLTSIDNLMDAEFGKTGTRQREAFRKERMIIV